MASFYESDEADEINRLFEEAEGKNYQTAFIIPASFWRMPPSNTFPFGASLT